jgi:hypothetical protein
MGFASDIVSFTPGFSPVPDGRQNRKPFQRFSPLSLWKPLKTISHDVKCLSTGLKPGVNETDFEAKTCR